MTTRLAPTFLTLIYEATLKSYWRRQALRRFLRQAGIADSFLSSWAQEESKRDFLDRLFAKLPDQSRGQELLIQMAKDLAAQDTFPHLAGWEDSKEKIRAATIAVAALRRAVNGLDDHVQPKSDQQAGHRKQRDVRADTKAKRHHSNCRPSPTPAQLTKREDDVLANGVKERKANRFRTSEGIGSRVANAGSGGRA